MSARRTLAALLATAVVAVGGMVAVGPAAAAPRSAAGPRQAEEAPETDPFDRLAGCIGPGGRLLVVLLVDESGSLNTTDPTDQRVAGAQAALASLERLRTTDTGGVAPTIDVLVSVFSYDFQQVGPWTTLGVAPTATAAVERRIAGLAERSTGKDTDFHNALDGARLALADRATSTTEAQGAESCKAVLLFTDGNFALGARTTPAERERFGTTKSYAPGLVLDTEAAAREATAKGIEALCDPGGVADQVRSDRITLFTVPLNVNLAEPGEEPRPSLAEGARRLIEALTVGEAEGRTCGDPDTPAPGVYLEASDTVELLRTFDLVGSRIAGGSVGDAARVAACPEEVCEDGSVAFNVDRSLRRVHVFASVPGPDSRVVLVPPEGDALELEPGDDRQEEVADVPVTVAWLSERAVTIDLDVPPDGGGAGTWRVGVVDPDKGRSVLQVTTFSDIIADLVDVDALELGEPVDITAEVVSRSGSGEVPDLETATVTATITDPITGRSVVSRADTGDATTLALTPDGDRFTGTVTVPSTVTAVAVAVALRLEATTTGGATISSVAPEIDLAVRRPPGYPQVGPNRIELTSIVGDGIAEGDLILVAPREGTGCVWFDDLHVRAAPEDAGALTIEVEGLGRAKAACTGIDSPLTLPVRITATEPASGTVTGHIRVFVAQGAGEEPLATDVPISFEMATAVDEAKRLALAVALLLGGLLLPLVLLVGINVATTRFQRLSAVRATKVPVAIIGRHQILRTDGDRRAFRLLGHDFHPLDGEGGRRRFTWGGLVFRARTPINPFGEPYAAVAPAGGTADVSRAARRTDLALGLSGSWLFLLDQDATRAATQRWVDRHGGAQPTEPPEIHGQLVAFAALDTAATQINRLLTDIDTRLPGTAYALARLANL